MGKNIFEDCEYCYINNIKLLPNVARTYSEDIIEEAPVEIGSNAPTLSKDDPFYKTQSVRKVKYDHLIELNITLFDVNKVKLPKNTGVATIKVSTTDTQLDTFEAMALFLSNKDLLIDKIKELKLNYANFILEESL